MPFFPWFDSVRRHINVSKSETYQFPGMFHYLSVMKCQTVMILLPLSYSKGGKVAVLFDFFGAVVCYSTDTLF